MLFALGIGRGGCLSEGSDRRVCKIFMYLIELIFRITCICIEGAASKFGSAERPLCTFVRNIGVVMKEFSGLITSAFVRINYSVLMPG